jgi:hypothetical protein
MFGRSKLEMMQDLGPRQLVCRGGERDARHAGKALAQHRELQVLRAEVVPPLRHAMRLVDGDQREAAGREQVKAARREQPFGRNVHEVELAAAHAPLDLACLGRAERGIEERRAHA